MKDGFWAFLTYGTFCLGAMLIINQKHKIVLIRTFTATMTVLAILTIVFPAYYEVKKQEHIEENKATRVAEYMAYYD